jgi:hypothetical protein
MQLIVSSGAMRLAAIPIAALLMASALPASAASLSVLRVPGRLPSTILIEGEFEAADAMHFASLLETLRREHQPARLVALDSPGGYVGEALTIAEIVRRDRLSTYVARLCASSCFNVFAAGVTRTASREASIGVHSAFSPAGPNVWGTAAMADYAVWCGTPRRIVSKLVSTPAPRIAWLKEADMRAMRVKLTP